MHRCRSFLGFSLLLLVACATPKTGAPSVSAELVDVQVSLESVMYVVAKLKMKNTGTAACRLTEYTLSWPGGSKVAKPGAFVIEAGAEIERTLRINPDSGDLDALGEQKDAAKIELSCQ